MFQKPLDCFLLLVLEYVMTPSVAVEIIPPKLTCTIPECKNVTFRCTFGDIEWLNPADVVINDTVTNRIHAQYGLLTITNPQVSDSGNYTCRARANHSDTAEAILTIDQRQPELSLSENRTMKVNITEEVITDCSESGCASATSFPVQIVTPIESCNIPQCSSVSFYCIAHDEEIEWLNPNNTVINSKSSSRIQTIALTGLMTITDPQVSDSGRYTCRARTNHNNYDEVMLMVNQQQSEVPLPENGTIESNNIEEIRPDCSESGCALTTSLPVQIDMSAETCTIPKCSSVSFHCFAHDEEIEWLNPNNTVINSTTSSRIYTIALTGLMTITNPQISDSGRYTCRAKANHSNHDEVMLMVNQHETFTFSNNFIYEEKTALRYTDVFINCSVSPTDAYTSWDFENTRIPDIIGRKYSKNISGLTIHNVTEEDQGHYICFLGTTDPPNATILLSVGWPPELFLPQNETMEVNINEEVILNCSASSSPHSVYTWLIPKGCSSCQTHSNNSTVTFIANISNSGDYICVAENYFGFITKQVTINVISKPLITTESAKTLIESEKRSNIILNCSVDYAYPPPIIEWSILNPLSNEYTPIQNDSTNYKLHRNGSFELLHRFLFEMGYMVVICSAMNNHGSANSTFHLWEHETFMRKKEFKIYLNNITNCEDLEKDKDLFREMMGSLREWFDSACENYCNGHNNLYDPQLTCVDDNTAIISSIVHNEGENSAQMLIGLARANIQTRNPPVVYLSNGWMLQLNKSSPENSILQAPPNNNSEQIVIGVSVGVAVVAIILLFIVIGTVFGIKKRYLKVRNTDVKEDKQTDDHIYDEVGNYSKVNTVSKSHSAVYNTKDDNIIFEVSNSQMPAYQPLKSLDDNRNRTRKENYNDYYIDGGDNSKVENIYKEEKYITSDCQKEMQNDNPYNKLMHIKQ